MRHALLTFVDVCLTACVVAGGLAGCSALPRETRTLTPLSGERELNALFARWNDAALRQPPREGDYRPCVGCPPIAVDYGDGGSMFAVRRSDPSSGTAIDAPTAVREAGPLAWNGDFLFVLRDNHVFTVHLDTDGALSMSGQIGLTEGRACIVGGYDGLLAFDSTIVAVGDGCDEEFGGTVVVLLDVASDGGLTRRASYQLGGVGYRLAREYAARLIGKRLVFYEELGVGEFVARSEFWFPAIRSLIPGAAAGESQQLLPPERIYRTRDRVDPLDGGAAFHVVVTCDPSAARMQCDATAVLSRRNVAFAVLEQAVLVWATPNEPEDEVADESMLVRIPTDGSAPSAVRTTGRPFGQDAFHVGPGDRLSVFVRLYSVGGASVRNDSVGDVALLRLSPQMFSDGRVAAPPESYRTLPRPDGPDVRYRFIGRHLMFGSVPSQLSPAGGVGSTLYIVDTEDGSTSRVHVDHGIGRIEPLGAEALVVGAKGTDLYLSGIGPSRPAAVTSRHVRRKATRDAAGPRIFYTDTGDRAGVLGVSVFEDASPTLVARRDWTGGAPIEGDVERHWPMWHTAVLFFRHDRGTLQTLGLITARDRHPCPLGNTTPFYLRDRIFVLTGCDIIEGRINGTTLSATHRLMLPPSSDSRQ